jgi:rhodanese-related sulfurtransferase
MKKTLLAVVFTALFASQTFAEPQTYKENEIEEIALKIHHETEQGGYELLSVVDLKKMIDDKENFVLIDAHPENQFNEAHIASANNFEFQGKFTRNWKDDVVGGSEDAYKALVGDNLNRKVVVYCGGNKCGRSNTAALWTKELGYHHVYRVTSGIKGWQDAGFPVVQSAKK